MNIEEEKGAEDQPRKKHKGRIPGAKNRIPAKGDQKRTYTAEQKEHKKELRKKRALADTAAKAADLQQVQRMMIRHGNAVISSNIIAIRNDTTSDEQKAPKLELRRKSRLAQQAAKASDLQKQGRKIDEEKRKFCDFIKCH